jgi:hypothetical protein
MDGAASERPDERIDAEARDDRSGRPVAPSGRPNHLRAVSSLSRDDIQKLAISIATDLCREDPPAVRGEMAKVAAAVANAIATNFAQEAAIRREAEEALSKLGRQGPGLDPDKLLQGLCERIAKQKGFVL